MIVFLLLTAVSFAANLICKSLPCSPVIVFACAMLLYFLGMFMTVFEKMPRKLFMLYKYLRFKTTDLILLLFVKTIIANAFMSIVAANFAACLGINFIVSFLLIFICGACVTFCACLPIVNRQKSAAHSNDKTRHLTDVFFKNRHSAFFFKTFFGSAKGCYEYIEMSVCAAVAVGIIVFCVCNNVNFALGAYFISFAVTASAIDIYALEFKNKNLSAILGLTDKQIFGFAFTAVSTLNLIFNAAYCIAASIVNGFDILNIAYTVVTFAYFMPVCFSLIITANRKLSKSLPISSAFLPDLIIAALPIINLIHAIYTTVKYTKEQKIAENR